MKEIIDRSALTPEQLEDIREEMMKPDKLVRLKNTMNEWISVKDRLPGIGEPVIFYIPALGVKPGFMAPLWAYTEDTEIPREDVTHWMPLPPPPEES